MKGVQAAILIRRNVVGLAVHSEGAVFDTIGITTNNAAKVGMSNGITFVKFLKAGMSTALRVQGMKD